MLQECACGEPIFDDLRACPRCGKPNPGFRHSRWRVLWPDVDTLEGADDAIRLGYWAAVGVAALGAVAALVAALGSRPASFLDAGLFALFGLGIWRKWRSAAVLAFLLLSANIVFSISRGGGVGALTVFLFVGLLNGMRGTFAHVKLSKAVPSEGGA